MVCKKSLYLMGVLVVLGLIPPGRVHAAPIVAKAWEFTSGLEGWTQSPNGQTSLTWNPGGYMDGTSSGNDPYMQSPAGLDVDITNARYVKVRLKNGTGSNTGQIYFGTAAAPGFAAARHTNFPIIPNDTHYTEYTIDMSTVAGWTGTLYRFRLDPAMGSGTFSVDYVRIQYQDVPFVQEVALTPSPVDGAVDVPPYAILGWEASPVAVTHDVYFGINFNDVRDASRGADPAGVLVSKAQADPSYDPGRLSLGQTYYWRVDEVNDLDPSSPWKGEVWRFTAEAVVYDVPAAAIRVSASSSSPGGDPNALVNGAGLNADGQHSINPADMWLSGAGDPNVNLVFSLDRIYKLAQLRIWNQNQSIESTLGVAAKDVSIDTSLDGTTWVTLKSVQLPQGPGQETYAGDLVDLGGVTAQYVRLNIHNNHGGFLPQYGLSEVRFGYIPTSAREFVPADGATGLDPRVDLSWRSGREAARHEVYLGTNPNALDLAATVNSPGYTAALDLEQDYYWQVREVNESEDPAVWTSGVMRFSTNAYRVVDDMETYKDTDGRWIWQWWSDGFEDPTHNGAVVGNGNLAETSIVVEGQSLPLSYNNTTAGGNTSGLSEATYTFAAPQDWTAARIKSLSIMFRGVAGNTGQLYCKIGGTKVPYSGSASDLGLEAWSAWNIDLSTVGGNLKSVATLTIGIQGGGTGTVYLDNIRLYPKVGETITPVVPGNAALVAHYAFEGDAADSTGAHNGTLMNGPQFVPGKQGQAINITLDQYVAIPYAASLGLHTFTVSVWVKVDDTTSLRGILGTRFNGAFTQTFDLKVRANDIHGDLGSGTAWLSTAVDIPGAISLNNWHHIAYAIDGAAGTARLYLNGALARTIGFSGTPLFMNPDQELRIGVSTGTEYLRGSIDEVCLYNQALSATEIAGLAGRTGVIGKPF